MKNLLLTVSAVTMLAASGAAAQTLENDRVDLESWRYDDLYGLDGVRAETIMDAEVRGPDGESFGEVENVWITDDRIVAITVESGGFLDIGDSHVVVPWDEVSFAGDGMRIPVTADNVAEYDAWDEKSIVTEAMAGIKVADDGGVTPAPGVFRLSDILNDYAVADGVSRGYVTDVLFSRDGEIRAVVFSGRGGAYATPWYGPRYGYAPYGPAYDTGYTVEELDTLRPYDYDRAGAGWY